MNNPRPTPKRTPSAKTPDLLSAAFWFSALLILLLSMTIGFMDYDDEGLFLLLARKLSEGGMLYDNLAYQYGPLYFWLTGVYFEIFGISHLTSRLLTLIIIFATTVVILKSGRLMLNDKELSYIPPFFWVIGIYPYIFESPHPGWLIAFLISCTAHLLIRIEKDLLSHRAGFFIIGILVAAITSIKPHIGVLNFLAIALLLFSRKNTCRREKIIIKIFFIFIIFFLFKDFLADSTLDKHFFYTAIPFCLMIIMILTYKDNNDVKLTVFSKCYKRFMFFLAGFLVIMLLIGIPTLYIYDIDKVFNHLFYFPSKQYAFFAGTSRNFSILALISTIPVLVAVHYTLNRARLPQASSLQLFMILLIFTTLAPFRPDHSALIIASVVFFLFHESEKFRDWRHLISRKLIIVFAFNFFHLYPLDIAHLCFVCPFLFVILAGLLLPEKTEYLRHKRAIILFSFVMATSIICFHKMSETTQPLGYSLNGTWIPDFKDPGLQGEVLNALNYIAQETEAHDKVITLGCFHSLNVWADRDSPGDIIHEAYNYYPETLQQTVIDDFCNTKIAVIYRSSRRLIKEIDSNNESRYKNNVLKALPEYFVEVDGDLWNQDTPRYLNIMVNNSSACERNNSNDFQDVK